ncbi:MAG TPA: ABC transporter ATP-binding protein [Thermoanaerobaculia bacterium]|nr:ABC transporter ATP-binding protein [Thermoanaerobaculia bacterium]
MNDSCLAELSGVHKRFGSTVALDGLDLAVGRRELLAVLGPNGAGKTTAISLLLGLQKPDSGAARLFGQEPKALAARRRAGVMMQEVFLAPELRVREQVDLVASYYPQPLGTDAVLEKTQITALAKRPYGKLSGGQKRQVQLAIAIVGRPELLFLDEPTVGLDVQARELLWATIRELVAGGASIVLTTHYLEEAEALADRVAVLAKGRLIASGSVNEIRALVTRSQIHCVTALTAEEVQACPGVETVHRDQHGLHITTREAEAVVRRLLAADPDITRLEVRRAGLAEAFTELTQETAS